MATKPSVKHQTSPGLIGQLTFSEPSVATRIVNSGGAYDILGSAASAVRVGQFASLMLANTASSAAYVKFGDSTVTAPTGIADGIYLPPNSLTPLASAYDTYVIASGSTVGVYLLKNDPASVTSAPNPPSPPSLPQPDES